MFRKKQQEIEKIIRPELTDDEIKEFERELEDYKQSATLDKDLSFYGYPIKDQEQFNGYVCNDILGGVHWSVIDYCRKNKILGRYKDGRWFIMAEVYEKWGGGKCATTAYNYFLERWCGLKNLKERRRYAKEKEAEAYQQLVL